MQVHQGLIQGGGWGGYMATNYDLYSFMIFQENCFQIQSQEGKFSNVFWIMPLPH